jgi:hypothetical protein
MEQLDELKRSVRTAMRAVDAAQEDAGTGSQVSVAVQQLAFVVDKLIDLLKASQTGEPSK